MSAQNASIRMPETMPDETAPWVPGRSVTQAGGRAVGGGVAEHEGERERGAAGHGALEDAAAGLVGPVADDGAAGQHRAPGVVHPAAGPADGGVADDAGESHDH